MATSCPSSASPSLCLNDPATTRIYTLSLHDALPIFGADDLQAGVARDVLVLQFDGAAADLLGAFVLPLPCEQQTELQVGIDRKSTRLNSSHLVISYAVFCLKKKDESGGTGYEQPIVS